jgi:hypothetical protein
MNRAGTGSGTGASTGAKYTCTSCRRGYQSKIYYNRHVGICELMCKSMKERQIENEEHADTPTIRVLYDVILELTNKMFLMEKKIQDLSKWADLKKKKINMVDWLNENQPTEGKTQKNWDEFLLGIKVGRIHLENLFQTEYTLGILKVLQDILPVAVSEAEAAAAGNTIKAFDNKVNVLFAFSDNKWMTLTEQMFQQLVNIVVKQLLNEFVVWQTENASRMEQDDFAIKYSANVKKMMGGNLTRVQVYAKVKIDLYKYLKVNVKNITEYHFV